MKKSILLFCLILMCGAAFAQQSTPPPATTQTPAAPQAAAPSMPAAKPQDVDTIDHIVAALYDVISGPAGQARDWDRFRSLFLPEARLVPNSVRPDGTIVHAALSPDDYVRRASGAFAQQGFFESETSRSMQQFGQIAQLFSTYESKHEKAGAPFARGINSIQVLSDGKRWYVVTVMWQAESQQNPIPAEYQKKP